MIPFQVLSTHTHFHKYNNKNVFAPPSLQLTDLRANFRCRLFRRCKPPSLLVMFYRFTAHTKSGNMSLELANLRREVHVLRQKAAKVHSLEGQNAQLHLSIARLEQENITLKDAVWILRKRLTEQETRTLEAATRISEYQRRVASSCTSNSPPPVRQALSSSSQMRGDVHHTTAMLLKASDPSRSRGSTTTSAGLSSMEPESPATDEDAHASPALHYYHGRQSVRSAIASHILVPSHQTQSAAADRLMRWAPSLSPPQIRATSRTPSPPPFVSSIEARAGHQSAPEVAFTQPQATSVLRTPPRRLFVTRHNAGKGIATSYHDVASRHAPAAQPSPVDVEVSAISSLFSPLSAAKADASVTSISPRRDALPSPVPHHRLEEIEARSRLHRAYLQAVSGSSPQPPNERSPPGKRNGVPVAPSRLSRSPTNPPAIRQALSVSPPSSRSTSPEEARRFESRVSGPSKARPGQLPPTAPHLPVSRPAAASSASSRCPSPASGRVSPAAVSVASLDDEIEEGIQRKLAMSFW